MKHFQNKQKIHGKINTSLWIFKIKKKSAKFAKCL
jgi:hypothetical protein